MRRTTLLLLAVAMALTMALTSAACAYSDVEKTPLGELYHVVRAVFPSREAIDARFGDRGRWSTRMLVSIHDGVSKYKQDTMDYPGIRIQLVDFRSEILVHRVDVQRRGLFSFLGIDIGSSRNDVIRRFGKPFDADAGRLHYGLSEDDEIAYPVAGLDIYTKNGRVTRMIYGEYFDAE